MNTAISMLFVSAVAIAFTPRSTAQEPGQPQVSSRGPVDVSLAGLGGAPGDAEREGRSGLSTRRPTASRTPLDCMASIADQAAPGGCLMASSTPHLGRLFPYPGRDNVITGTYATVGGGRFNEASDYLATVAGGAGNRASAGRATVGGGQGNSASGFASFVGGGLDNTASGAGSTVGGGGYYYYGPRGGNTASGIHTTVGGGVDNTASGRGATVAGGGDKTFYYGLVGNTASGPWSAVGGGVDNTASGRGATVAGGGGIKVTFPYRYSFLGNTASGDYATVPGGDSNAATGNHSFAAGRRALADHDGAFVWGDSQDVDKPSSLADEFNVYCSGGARFFTNSAASTGVLLAPGGSSWTMVSDRDAKENVEPVDARAVLDEVARLPLATWNYKEQDDSIRHMGPMAQDFHAAFGLGLGETTIDTIDPSGVALAAIQGLDARLDELRAEKDAELGALLAEKNAEIEELRAANEALLARMERLEALARTAIAR